MQSADEVPNARRLTVTLGLNQLLSWAMTFYLPAVIADVAAHDLGVSQSAVLGGFSWALLVTGACAPRVGRWIGRNGGRSVLAGSTVVMAAGLLLLAAAPNLWLWYAAWTVMGAGMALGLYDAAFATAGVALGPAIGPVLTGVTLFGGFASTLGWPAGTALVGLVGWRATLVVYAAVQLGLNLPLVLAGVPSGGTIRPQPDATPRTGREGRWRLVMAGCMAAFFSVRWFLTSAIAAQVLPLMAGLGLSKHQAVLASMLIGPGQVAGRLLEWSLSGRLGPMALARMGAMLFPAGAVLLAFGGPLAASGFALLYGMSNGILTINRGTLPMLVLGAQGYAALLGWLAVPVLLSQAAAPALTAPLIGLWPAPVLLMGAGAIAAVVSGLLLLLRPAAPS